MSPRAELVDEAEDHLRALLRDVLCGYLDADLKGVADDILLESDSEPFMDGDTQDSELQEIEARDLRKEPRFERAADHERQPRRTSTSIQSQSTSRSPTTTQRPTTRPSSMPSPTPPSSRR